MGAFFQGLLHVGLYKRTQGRITRQVTAASVAVVLALGCWRLMEVLIDSGKIVSYAVPSALLLASLWVSYRLVNVPSFADFLIAVEAEMNKVSWPTRNELIRSSIVVLVTIFALAAILFLYDYVWNWVFIQLGVIPRPA
jgi:preprotein translocase subunit SecE